MIDETIFRNVLKAIKEKPEYTLDIVDSFSDNQFKSKNKLLSHIDKINLSNHDVAILGCWYGSILVPKLASKSKKIIAVDLDDNVVRIGKNKFFSHCDNVVWSTGDVFTKQLDYSNVKLVVNTSCEHMPSMKEWPYWANVSKNCYFAFTSNNMYNIEGHINCVECIEEFKEQLPESSIVSIEEEITDERGTRFLLVGQIDS